MVKRKDQKIEDTWRLEDIYENNDLWEQDLKKIDKYCEKIVEFKGHILDSAENLLNYLKLDEEVSQIIEQESRAQAPTFKRSAGRGLARHFVFLYIIQ